MQINKTISFLIILFLIFSIFFFSYFFVERKDWQRKVQYNLYALELKANQQAWQCDTDAPKWMHKVLIENTKALESFANQISYISPDGKQYNCVSGGVAAFHDKNKVTTATRFVFASLTKIITSAQLLELAEQDKIKLNNPALPILGTFNVQDKRLNDIHVIDLMRHQAGFDRSIAGEPMFQQKDWVWCPQHLERLNEMELQYAPGQKAIYSNLGYCLLGQVLENTLHTPYRQATLEYLNKIVPHNHFKFIDESYYNDEVKYDDFHNYIDNFRITRDMQSVSSLSGLSGNANDLAKFYKYLFDKYGGKYVLNQKNYQCRKGGLCRRGVLFEKIYDTGFQIYLGTGTYPGFTGYAILDEKGGVFVSFSNGYTSNQSRMNIVNHMREYLLNYYS